ncbi:hypothetical protein J4Q44_G00300780 [Coregonus suidteri]|uniref:Uncharacterized protein n=1 Tax=Coregonus suidteri TaxID=861788 RepID=A0AAN8L2M6_9TELE
MVCSAHDGMTDSRVAIKKISPFEHPDVLSAHPEGASRSCCGSAMRTSSASTTS